MFSIKVHGTKNVKIFIKNTIQLIHHKIALKELSLGNSPLHSSDRETCNIKTYFEAACLKKNHYSPFLM